jgi:hypothetical protein
MVIPADALNSRPFSGFRYVKAAVGMIAQRFLPKLMALTSRVATSTDASS